MASAPASSEDNTHSRPTALGRLTGSCLRTATSVGGPCCCSSRPLVAPDLGQSSPAAGSYSTLQQTSPSAPRRCTSTSTSRSGPPTGCSRCSSSSSAWSSSTSSPPAPCATPAGPLPIVAAAGGVVVPAVFYPLAVVGDRRHRGPGWAIPAATDIAFAVAVLAVVGRGLPSAVRTFLLTLAVVDDLIAITIIAVGYTADVAPCRSCSHSSRCGVFAALTRRGYCMVGTCSARRLDLGVRARLRGARHGRGVLVGLVVPARRAGRRTPVEPAVRWLRDTGLRCSPPGSRSVASTGCAAPSAPRSRSRSSLVWCSARPSGFSGRRCCRLGWAASDLTGRCAVGRRWRSRTADRGGVHRCVAGDLAFGAGNEP